MRLLGLSGVTRAKAIRTTIQTKNSIRAGDLLCRDFTAPRPDHTWVTDFTYCRTWAGWVYVAFILDVFLATHRGLARADQQARRARDDPAANGPLGTLPARAPDPARAAAGAFGRREGYSKRLIWTCSDPAK